MDYNLDDNLIPDHRYGRIGAFLIVALFGIALYVILSGAFSRAMVSVHALPGASSISFDGESIAGAGVTDRRVYTVRARPGEHVIGFQGADGAAHTKRIVIEKGESVVVFAVAGDSLRQLTRQ